ncbi:MAG: 5'-deoxynucleotidase [Ruminococcaceae bacterium]|nr:5'-deoxynucleotidase [Oscillospiraceae bacterium]
MTSSFFALLFRQKYIRRWGLMRSSIPETLAEHTAEAAVIAHALAVIGNTVYGKSYDPDRAAALALFHDAPEVLTGDLPTPIKYFSPEMKAGYSKIEENAVETLLSKLPDELKGAYEPLLTPAEADAETMRLIKIADRLCAYIKCLTEEAGGNRDFLSARRSIEQDLDRIDSDELRYFREHLLGAFSLTIDDM